MAQWWGHRRNSKRRRRAVAFELNTAFSLAHRRRDSGTASEAVFLLPFAFLGNLPLALR
jgi:hypothetical protein